MNISQEEFLDGNLPFMDQEKKNSEIILTDEFKDILDIVKNTNESIFITGKAGTGKSTLFNQFIRGIGKNLVVLAPTGVAALNVKGQTIHSFFKLPFTVFQPALIKEDVKRKTILKKIDTIIIDEISMVRSDTLHAIDLIMRVDRGDFRPFGGVQMIFIGDLYQLPPVVTGDDKNELFDLYNGEYFFHAPVFNKSNDSTKNFNYHFKELTKIFRQDKSQTDFINILNSIRVGSVTQSQINTLNKRCKDSCPDDAIYLTSLKKTAKEINDDKLAEIKKPIKTYQGKLSGKLSKLKNYSEDKIDNSLPAPYNLKLKVGARIMLIKNDKMGRWVNGTMAIVVGLHNNSIDIKVKNNHYNVKPETWEEMVNKVDSNGNLYTEVVSSYTQYPIQLGYAITIHKSQGKTFEQVYIDLGTYGAFASGQLYVALSRCVSLDGLTLRKPIKMSDIIVDDSVINYYQNK